MPDLYVPTPQYGQGADFSWLANLPDQYFQGTQQKQTLDQQNAFKGGVPTNPDGTPNYAAVLQMLAKTGDTAAVGQFGPASQDQIQQRQAGKLDPMLANLGGGAAAPAPAPDLSNLPPASAAAARSTTAPPASGTPQTPQAAPAAQDGASVDQIAGQMLPTGKSGTVAVNVARAIRIDPNAPLNSDQQAQVRKLLNAYAARNGIELPGSGLLANSGIRSYIDKVHQIESGNNPNARNGSAAGIDQLEPATARQYGVTDPYDPAQSDAATAKLTADNAAALTKRLGRVPTEDELYLAHQQGAAGAARLLGNPDAPAVNVVGRKAVLQNGGTADMTAGQFAQLQMQRFARAGGGSQGQGQPIVPQTPLPPGFKDPQQAILAMDAEIAKLSVNPYNKGQVQALQDWRDRIAGSTSPLSVGGNTTLVDPRTGQTLYQGANARGGSVLSPQALDAAAENYYQTGKLPPNLGRGMQGSQVMNSIITRATELHPDADWNARPSAWQDFAAGAAGSRALSTRGANLELAANEATSLIPRVKAASAAVSRTNYPSLNSIILAGQQGTGDPNVVRFGIAVNSLINTYARAIKPTGSPTVSDINDAKSILDKAWSDGQVDAALDQMQKEIDSSKSALRRTRQEFRDGGAPVEDTMSAPPQGGGAPGAPPSPAASAAPPQVRVGSTATNPQTGAKIRWDGQAWQPVGGG